MTTAKGAYKNGKIAKFRSDILKTNEDTTSQCHELKGGFKLGPHNTFVKFRNFRILLILNLDSASTVAGATDKVDQSYYRKITIHSEKVG